MKTRGLNLNFLLNRKLFQSEDWKLWYAYLNTTQKYPCHIEIILLINQGNNHLTN